MQIEMASPLLPISTSRPRHRRKPTHWRGGRRIQRHRSGCRTNFDLLVVSGPGDEAPLFTLETNGTLKTATTFDLKATLQVVPSACGSRTSSTQRSKGASLFRPTCTNPQQSPVDLNSSINLEMIWVEPGTFSMGQSNIAGASPCIKCPYERFLSGNTR